MAFRLELWALAPEDFGEESQAVFREELARRLVLGEGHVTFEVDASNSPLGEAGEEEEDEEGHLPTAAMLVTLRGVDDEGEAAYVAQEVQAVGDAGDLLDVDEFGACDVSDVFVVEEHRPPGAAAAALAALKPHAT